MAPALIVPGDLVVWRDDIKPPDEVGLVIGFGGWECIPAERVPGRTVDMLYNLAVIVWSSGRFGACRMKAIERIHSYSYGL